MVKKPASRNHKRHRRQTGSLAGTTLPRLSIPVPSPSPPQHHSESVNTTPNGDSKARPKTAPQPLTDDSEIRAQISTLSLIKTYGYGPILGTPLLRSSNSASSIVRGGVSRKRVRNDGMNAPDGARRATSASGGRGGRGVVRPQQPWMGPMESSVGLREGTAVKARCCGHALSCIIMRSSER